MITLEYDPVSVRGTFRCEGSATHAAWIRLRQGAISADADYRLTSNSIDIPWLAVLTLIREFASLQNLLGFRIRPIDKAKPLVDKFIAEYRAVLKLRGTLATQLSESEVIVRLQTAGFTERTLTKEQLRDVRHLLALQSGANFSVPGAGKTTVAIAVHLLAKSEETRLMVIAPKNAFPAWRSIIDECMSRSAPLNNSEQFTVLTDGIDAISDKLQSPSRRYLISYDQVVRVSDLITNFLARYPVHLILDESHRMKAGTLSQRGSVLLNLSPLPVRRDILSGTPMPQQASDIQSQLDFLWPGSGLGEEIERGAPPKAVLGNLYVRTTKAELGLPDPKRHFIQVDMGRGQLALYGVLRNETLSQLSQLRHDRRIDIVRARRSVMRLLQVSTNPVLALEAMADGTKLPEESGIVQAVLEEGPSPKMRAVAAFARELAQSGQKCVIWTIFTNTLQQLEEMLADINPVTLYGDVPSGESDSQDTREGRIRRFHEDPQCWTMIANPAAASEGISLHHVCHNAIYVDRSYNTTHFLQSIDRIHRLGLDPNVETSVYIFQTRAPQGLGSIDHSVSLRLATKMRALQSLLDDPDLHRLALDEENADAPIAFDILPEDLDDLLVELEGRRQFFEDDAI